MGDVAVNIKDDMEYWAIRKKPYNQEVAVTRIMERAMKGEIQPGDFLFEFLWDKATHNRPLYDPVTKAWMEIHYQNRFRFPIADEIYGRDFLPPGFHVAYHHYEGASFGAFVIDDVFGGALPGDFIVGLGGNPKRTKDEKIIGEMQFAAKKWIHRLMIRHIWHRQGVEAGTKETILKNLFEDVHEDIKDNLMHGQVGQAGLAEAFVISDEPGKRAMLVLVDYDGLGQDTPIEDRVWGLVESDEARHRQRNEMIGAMNRNADAIEELTDAVRIASFDDGDDEPAPQVVNNYIGTTNVNDDDYITAGACKQGNTIHVVHVEDPYRHW